MAETEQASEDIGLAKKREAIARLVGEYDEVRAKIEVSADWLERTTLLARAHTILAYLGMVRATPARGFV